MQIKYTKEFEKWYSKLSDCKVKASILRRLDKIKSDNHFGDMKNIDINLYELRFFISSGIRVYFTFKNDVLIILLCGGDKSSQSKDIQKAKNILKDLKDD